MREDDRGGHEGTLAEAVRRVERLIRGKLSKRDSGRGIVNDSDSRKVRFISPSKQECVPSAWQGFSEV